MTRTIAITVSCLFLCGSLAAQTPDDQPDQTSNIQTLDETLKKQTDSGALPGAAMTIVKDGETVFQKAFGVAGNNESPYTNSTVQPIGSISKTFIALAIMKCVDQGHFDLDTKINDVLPFQVVNPNSPDDPITIKHLVTHTSGIVDGDEFYISCYRISPAADAESEILKKFLAEGANQGDRLPLGKMLKNYLSEEGSAYKKENFLDIKAGERCECSNIASSLAAYLVECKVGMPYAEFVKRQVFEPLQMSDTKFLLDTSVTPNASSLFFAKEKPLPAYVNDSYPDGSVQTSNQDLTKYMMAMIKLYHGESDLLSTSSAKSLFRPQMEKETPGLRRGKLHSVFWVVEGAQVGHDGSDPGVSAFLKINMKTKSGLIFITNIDTDISEKPKNVLNAIRSSLKAAFPVLKSE